MTGELLRLLGDHCVSSGTPQRCVIQLNAATVELVSFASATTLLDAGQNPLRPVWAYLCCAVMLGGLDR